MFSKNTQISNFEKIRPVGGRAVPCGRTDVTKLIVTFRNFANAPKNHIQIHTYRNECYKKIAKMTEKRKEMLTLISELPFRSSDKDKRSE